MEILIIAYYCLDLYRYHTTTSFAEYVMYAVPNLDFFLKKSIKGCSLEHWTGLAITEQ